MCGDAYRCSGPQSSPVEAKSKGGVWPPSPYAPRITRVLGESHSIKVTWSTPPQHPGLPTRSYGALAVGGPGQPRACSTTLTSCTISGLTSGDYYTITVYARTDVGSSKASQYRTARA